MARKKNVKAMTVGQLVNELTQFDQDRVVEIASDPEGNYFAHVDQLTDEGNALLIWPTNHINE